MKKAAMHIVTLTVISASVSTVLAAGTKTGRGETLFNDKCAACHMNGDNSINDKTLRTKDLLKANLRNKNDIVRFLRDNNTSMPKFSKKELPDKDASEIAKYILKTFK